MWKAEYPRQVRAMMSAGTLHDNLAAAEDMAGDVYADAIQSGMNPDQAWELEREAVRDLARHICGRPERLLGGFISLIHHGIGLATERLACRTHWLKGEL